MTVSRGRIEKPSTNHEHHSAPILHYLLGSVPGVLVRRPIALHIARVWNCKVISYFFSSKKTPSNTRHMFHVTDNLEYVHLKYEEISINEPPHPPTASISHACSHDYKPSNFEGCSARYIISFAIKWRFRRRRDFVRFCSILQQCTADTVHWAWVPSSSA